MTDEEMAEEYYNSKFKSNESHFSKFDIEQAFLAELKEGTPKWHKIGSKVTPKREISKQYMPKNKKKVLLKYHFSDDDEIHIADGYYDAYDSEFHIANNQKFRIVCVIAWREFSKKENE